MKRKYYEYEPRDKQRGGEDILSEPLRTAPDKEKDGERCVSARDRCAEDYGINRDIYLTAEEASEYYSVSQSTVYNLADDAGAVKRTGRRVWINRNVMDRYLENFRF